MNRETVLERIRNLRAKASNEASSEAEAKAAADQAAKLLFKYDVEETELHVKEQGATEAFMNVGSSIPDVLRYAKEGIAEFTQTRYAWHKRHKVMYFFGSEPDVQMALYLTELIRASGERAWKQHRLGLDTFDRIDTMHHRKGFLLGFGWQMKSRLVELTKQRNNVRSDGTSLVPVKEAMIDEYLKSIGLSISRSRNNRRSQGDTRSAVAGTKAAQKVDLNTPMEGSNDANQLPD